MTAPLFTDRAEAGRQLAEKLRFLQSSDPVIIALPRGGVPVAFEIASALAAPLDIVLVRKIGVPGQPELALGAIVDGARPELVINEELRAGLHIADDFIDREKKRQLTEIDRRRKLWLAGRPRQDIVGRTAIVVDDGIATGATVRAALRALRRAGPASLVLAVPVAPPDVLETLKSEADEIVCLHAPRHLRAISAFYRRFPQLDDSEVADILARRPVGGQAER